MFDPTGWDLILLILVVFASWFIVGAVLDFVLSYVAMSRSVRGGGRAPKSRLARICLALLAALLAAL